MGSVTWLAQVGQAAEVGKQHFRAGEGRGRQNRGGQGRGGEGMAGQRRGRQGRAGQGRAGCTTAPWEAVPRCCSSPAELKGCQSLFSPALYLSWL